MNLKDKLLNVIDYAINQYKKEYSERYKDTDLCLYKKYTYEDVMSIITGKRVLYLLILVVINMMNIPIHYLYLLIMIKMKIFQIQ